MITYGPAVNQKGFTASNVFALQAAAKVVEEMAGPTVPVEVVDVGPYIGVTLNLRQTTRQKAIYFKLVGDLSPMGYRVALEGDTLFISPLDTREN